MSCAGPLGIKSNYLVVGRAATGIYALLRAKFTGREVVVPANICPAAVYPIVYSGNKPVFCDVESPSGNVSLQRIQGCITVQTSAVIVPHMYGNPVQGISEISRFCAERGIMMIEDCASAMGAEINGVPVGSFGDYAIYSTGHAKILDLGGGGLIVSDNDLCDVEAVVSAVKSDHALAAIQESRFAKTYRRFLNTRAPLSCYPDKHFFSSDFRDMLLVDISTDRANEIIASIKSDLSNAVNERRERQLAFEQIFDSFDIASERYRYGEGAVSWRFSFFVSGKDRQRLADAMLEAALPVSDWYPAMAELFDDNGEYPTAYNLGRTILNLPLTLSTQRFADACRLIVKYCKTKA